MFSAEDYLQGWIVYSIGVACILLFLWLVMKKSAWTTLRHLILLLCASVLLTPVTAYRDDSHLAPCIFCQPLRGGLAVGCRYGFPAGPGTDYCGGPVCSYFLRTAAAALAQTWTCQPCKENGTKRGDKKARSKSIKSKTAISIFSSRPVLIFPLPDQTQR